MANGIRACAATGLLSPRRPPPIRCFIVWLPRHNLAIKALYTISEEHVSTTDTFFRGLHRRRGRAAYPGMLLGPVAEYCVRNGPYPVVVVALQRNSRVLGGPAGAPGLVGSLAWADGNTRPVRG